MKRVKGSRGWIAAAFTILFTVGLIAVRTNAAIQPSGEAPSTLPAPVLHDVNGGVACPYDTLYWTSVTGATSYQLWNEEIKPHFVPYTEFYSGTANVLGITLSGYYYEEYAYEVRACNAQGCGGFSNGISVQNSGPTC